ncbi:N(4)-(Beta-N-acetylglucosaminyl)-L-asparaginase-like [Dromiciops gliroides]|uniref:N(4)-(Beta-N-acetylglucosaminyl)-L-asparaginase- like n=1 Tax=Dromiciops gliroides TaxID=33562 RepID=UPI001CC6F50A|nr:N(4)-(Beta-N-acetylglucosaminyl)-L-asparaginase-like [Dromiciops gliroides]
MRSWRRRRLRPSPCPADSVFSLSLSLSLFLSLVAHLPPTPSTPLPAAAPCHREPFFLPFPLVSSPSRCVAMAAAVGTWAFSMPAVRKLGLMLKKGAGSTDSLQAAMEEIENSEETGQYIVGRGGYPNRDGLVQCDAAIMEGTPGRFGAVAALHGIGTPIAVARKVMDNSVHSLLVGDGAIAFAREEGFIVEENEHMLSKHGADAYQEYLGKRASQAGHDTLGLIALDTHGNITVGVSTSGSPFKYPGRVGDSPLPGCGLYADYLVGAAAATGEGDKIMCFCPCFHVILLMKQGLSPKEACESVLKHITNQVGHENMFELGIIAMNIKGETGAASSVQFTYCVWSQENDSIEQLIQPAFQP